MSRWTPCKRREFIRRLRQLGFDGPFSGTRHQFMVYRQYHLAIPSNAEYSVDQATAFVLSQPVTTLCSVGDVTVLPKVLAAAERCRPLDPAEQEALVATADRYHSPFVGQWA